MMYKRYLVLLVGCCWLSACCGSETDETPDEGPTPEGTTPAVGELEGPSWGVPESHLPANPGDYLFAAIPKSDSWDMVVWKGGTMGTASGNAATFVATTGEEVPNVPGSLMMAIGEAPELEAGDVVIGEVHGSCQLALVESVEGERVYARTVWVGKPTDLELPLGQVKRQAKGLSALGMAAYPDSGEMLLGWVAAVGPKTVWMIAASGKVVEVPREKVVSIVAGTKHVKGDQVYAATDGAIFTSATVEKVVENGLQYEVAYRSDDPTLADNRVVPFWEVTTRIKATKMPLKPYTPESYEPDPDADPDKPQRGEAGYTRGGTQRGGKDKARKVTKPKR